MNHIRKFLKRVRGKLFIKSFLPTSLRTSVLKIVYHIPKKSSRIPAKILKIKKNYAIIFRCNIIQENEGAKSWKK